MSKSVKRTPVPAVLGRRLVSAYIFSDESETYGVVLGLDDGSDISIEFSYQPQIEVQVLQLRSEDDEPVLFGTA